MSVQTRTSTRTRIKMCGFTREADVQAAVQAGADAIGFVLYPPSPRAVSIERAAELAALLPAFVTPVLLFVNEAPERVQAACAAVPGALAVGVAAAILGQVGDLFESWLKRRAGVKDSGNLIPGHGGLLDRVDGLILTVPAFALLVWF